MKNTLMQGRVRPGMSLSTALIVMLVLIPTFSLAALGLRALDKEVSLQRLEASQARALEVARLAKDLRNAVSRALTALHPVVKGFNAQPTPLRDWILSQGVADLVWRSDVTGDRQFPPNPFPPSPKNNGS